MKFIAHLIHCSWHCLKSMRFRSGRLRTTLVPKTLAGWTICTSDTTRSWCGPWWLCTSRHKKHTMKLSAWKLQGLILHRRASRASTWNRWPLRNASHPAKVSPLSRSRYSTDLSTWSSQSSTDVYARAILPSRQAAVLTSLQAKCVVEYAWRQDKNTLILSNVALVQKFYQILDFNRPRCGVSDTSNTNIYSLMDKTDQSEDTIKFVLADKFLEG